MLIGKKQSRQNHGQGRRILVRITIGLILVFALASAVAIYFEQEARFARMQKRNTELSAALNEANSRHADLLELRSIVDSDEYIERIAREKLGMVRPNEIIFIDIE